MARMGGPDLFRKSRAYCRDTGTSIEALAMTAGVSRSRMDKLEHTAFPKQDTVDRLLGAMALNPKGIEHHAKAGPKEGDGGAGALAAAIARASAPCPLPPPPATIAEAIAREAVRVGERRAQALRDGGEPLSLACARTEAREDIAALIATVQRRAPSVWAKLRTKAGEVGTMPGALLVELVERALGEAA